MKPTEWIAEQLKHKTDIVERLRACSEDECNMILNLEAADEIERLRAALQACIPYIEGMKGDPVAILEHARSALTAAK